MNQVFHGIVYYLLQDKLIMEEELQMTGIEDALSQF